MRKFHQTLLAFAASAFAFGAAAPAQAGESPFIGEVMFVGFTFCPRDWVKADGQLLPIDQNTALFSMLGDYYGGDGRTTFAVPDLRGRVPMGNGQGSGLPLRKAGETGGSVELAHPLAQEPSSSRAEGVPYLVLTACIAVKGAYPSRS